jgi:hypothetical protein
MSASMFGHSCQFVSFATRALAVVGALQLAACIDDPPGEAAPGAVSPREEEAAKGKSVDAKQLPVIDAVQASEVFVQQLPASTKAGENVAVHVRLPPPSNPELAGSLVRLVGDPKRPLVLVRSDVLVQLGRLKESPGKQFFTAFARLDAEELEKRQAIEAALGKAKKPSTQRIVFDGRTPIAVTTGLPFDIDIFKGGKPVPLGPCPLQPLSELARWEEALIVTDLAVVRDKERTNDVCDPGGDNPDGVWTFKHLMAEMATGSGLSTHDFVVDWLSHWLTSEVVNGDTLTARTNMFNQVIRPWADASGIASALGPDGALKLDGELDLDLAPFRLSAIVNRIDLGATEEGPAGYGGGSTSRPTTAGELRFVFGVQNLDSCAVMRFSVIFEYGVPITGCNAVKQWALDWTELSDPSLTRFSDPWRQHLEDLTQSVVLSGAAPKKGNQNAINQVRTNENALHPQWQFREFTLTKEDPSTGVDTPVSGPLRAHTVAQTPDDTVYDDNVDATIDDFVLFTPVPGAGLGVVRSAVSPGVGSFTAGSGREVLTDCAPSYEVPHLFNKDEFRGGDSFTANPTRWRVDAADPSDLLDVCAREQFSLNTCNGCHFSDTDTFFFHVDPQAAPAGLSNFMTGGVGGLWAVPDQQWSAQYEMQFNDLDRRHNRLYEIACAQCGKVFDVKDDIVDIFVDKFGVVPIDPIGPVSVDPKIKVGPITTVKQVETVLSLTASATLTSAQDLELGQLVRRRETFAH